MLAGRATLSRLAALARYSSGVRGSHSSLLGFPRPMKAERVMPCVFSPARSRAAILLLIPAGAVALARCDGRSPVGPPPTELATGTWGRRQRGHHR